MNSVELSESRQPTEAKRAAAVARSAKRKAYLHIVLPLFITSIIAYMDRVNLSYAALTMNKDLGFSDEVFGLGAGIFFAGYVLFEIPGALLAERYSPKWWLARIMISWGAISGLLAFVSTEWQFYVLRFLLGAAEASLYPVLYASCIPRWFAVNDRARAIAVMLTSLQISSIIGAPLAGWLLGIQWQGLSGWQCLFLLEALPAILFAFVLLFVLADSPEQARWLTAEERAYLLAMQSADASVRAGAKHFTVGQALSDPEVIRLCIIYFLWITGFWGFTFWMPTVLKSASSWSNIKLGWMIVIPMLLSLTFMIYIGDRSSRTGEKRWHGACGLFLAAAGMLLGTLTTQPIVAFALMCATAIGVYAPFGVWWSYPTSFLSGPAAAGAVGLINSVGNIGGFVGPYITGVLTRYTGSFTAAWIYLGASLALAGALMLTLDSDRAKRRIQDIRGQT